jgi:uncharacterized protein YodC (DUF2158 family)
MRRVEEMMAEQFKAGKTVSLNSGGQRMTVKSVSGEDVTCEWFDDKKVAQLRVFKASSLKLDDGVPGFA